VSHGSREVGGRADSRKAEQEGTGGTAAAVVADRRERAGPQGMAEKHVQRPLGRLVLGLIAFTVAVCMPMRWEHERHSRATLEAGIDSSGLPFVDNLSSGWHAGRRPGCPRIAVEYVRQTYYNRDRLPTRRFTLEALFARGVTMSENHAEHGAIVGMAIDRLHHDGVLSAADVQRLARTPLINTSSIHWPGWCRLLLLPVAAIGGLLLVPWRWLLAEAPRALALTVGAERDPMICASCAYPLAGLPTRICPECGHANEPASARACT